MDNKQPTKAEQEALAKKIAEEHTVTLTMGQLIIIYNVLASVSIKYGDAMQFKPIMDALQPIVAVDSSSGVITK